jgi:tRNA nucleotidyltransferase (CCA-adding enzyme)
MELKKVLEKEVERIRPEKEMLKKINSIAKKVCSEISFKLKKESISADVFIGGSIAKNTLIKKDKYDVDIFIRFDKKYGSDKISLILRRLLRNAKKIHGSRDYYQIVRENIILEIIPVMRIKKPEKAENVTDLSYFHVRYIVSKIKKNKRLAEEIMLAKTFCYAQNCYGAEGYIHGFSGYALELLICHYGSFAKMLKELSKKEEKIIIDDGGFYKNKEDILMNVNEAKLKSPVILIDPTFKERNALAGLSTETFSIFKEVAKRFLKNPSLDFFEKKPAGEEMEVYENINRIRVKTNKQAGDIAGTKSKKFFDFFIFNLKKEFNLKRTRFDYNEKENASYFYFLLDKKPDEIIRGPHIIKTDNLRKFKRVHPNATIKNHFAYARISHNKSFEEWFRDFKRKYKPVFEQMSIKEVELDFS